jgi:nucleotide-binding universal stress UspA family protein
MFQRILLAWDGSEVALRAFDVAIDITRRYDAELVAVSIAYSPAHAETAADRQQTADAAHQYLTQTFNDVIDPPAGALIGFAHDHAFDLIVCGHHPSHRAGRMWLRGITRQLIDGPVPVLVVSNGTR